MSNHNYFLITLIFALLFTFSMQKVHASVWETKNQWSPEWEAKYSEWVEKEWDDEVFMREGSILKGLATDCADATYAMRILFSYLSNLPFRSHVKNQDLGRGYVTNEVSTLDYIKNSQDRFRKFLIMFFEFADTNTLSQDTYPIEINRKSLTPGSIYVAPGDHSYQIKKLNENGVPTSYSSTTPADVRYLQILESFPLLSPIDFKTFKDGYRKFKQPEQLDVLESSLQFYSLMQFQIAKKYPDDFMLLGDELSNLLMVVPESKAQKMERAMINLCYSVQGRAYIISKTEKRKYLMEESCMTPKEYDAESTPSRDKKIMHFYDYLANIYLDVPAEELQNSSYYNLFLGIFTDEPTNVKAVKDWCNFQRFDSTLESLSLRSVFKSIQSGSFISDPNVNRAQRWGMEPYNPVCPRY